MKSIFLIILLLAITSGATAQHPGAVTEIAIYRIKPGNQSGFTPLLTAFRSQVSQLKGYQDYVTLQDVHQPSIYLDLLHWNDLTHALAAAEVVKTDKVFQPFIRTLDSLLAYGEFYLIKSISNPVNKNKMTSNVTEVVIYRIKADQVALYDKTAELANGFLQSRKGFISRKVLQDHRDKSVFMDLVEWESLADAESAMQAAQQEATLMPFFEATEKVLTFSHYTFFK